MLWNQFIVIMLCKGRCQKHTEGVDSFLGGGGKFTFLKFGVCRQTKKNFGGGGDG